MRRTALLLAASLLLTGCAGGDDEPKSTSSPKPSIPLPTGTPVPRALAGPKSTTLQQTDLVVGTGESVFPGMTLTVKYVGALYDGTVFDSAFDEGRHPLTFTLANGDVIPGWDQGLLGMRVGGRRQLVIPPDLGYGAEGSGPIPPNATLIFVVDLLSADGGAGGGVATFAPR